MQKRNYHAILYFIASVIAITLAIQVYWNYKNYQAGKQQLKNEMQISLDAALDNYYVDLADDNTIGFALKNNSTENKAKLDSLIRVIDLSHKGLKGLDSLDSTKMKEIMIFSGSQISDMDTLFRQIKVPQEERLNAIKHFLNGKKTDSLNNLAKLTSRIILSITTDTLDLTRLNHYIDEQLKQKNLELAYGYSFKNNTGDTQNFNIGLAKASFEHTSSKSAYLPKKSIFNLYYKDSTFTILKRNLVGIILSTLLIAAVIACLLFLLRIINQQKQLAELKNDLISNITHEFKTPIATIHVALEGITHFNAENDPKKTKNYIETSNFQLGKLNTMVEKLLETATLDGDSLKLKKEEIDLVQLLKNLIKKHQSLAPLKVFETPDFPKQLIVVADAFHLENALNNIIDNAVKYGGNLVKVILKDENRAILINIEDNGNTLTSAQAQHIFEKFYRVPKGNMHDVKGFGIGLYYTKKIIEKHDGKFTVEINGKTTFKISLPHV